ncbi:MAG TPA: HD domain-containing phosphohydrolase [Candidatus Baltobacteraceae bacterium]|nr:HD domain-containing phosphohydrolase [Candidatus Baltobacteraceae bacterium]
MTTAAQGGTIRALDLLGALSFMADMALGLSAGHGVRTTYISMCVGRELHLPDDDLADLFYAGLLTDAGCTAWASHTAATLLDDDRASRRDLFFFTDPADPRDMLKWMVRYLATGQRIGVRLRRAANLAVAGRRFMTEALQNTSEAAARFARRLDRSPRVQDALRNAFERWDGSGPWGQRSDSIPLISRITYAAIYLEVFHGIHGRTAAIDLARNRRAKDLDPSVADAFVRIAKRDDFWHGLEGDSIWTLVREMEPESPFRYFSEERLDDAARAFGDFADLKSFYTGGHARRVSALAESMARIMNLSQQEVRDVRRGALLHDIGVVAVPSFMLHKPHERLSEAERETVNLHPYHSERILARASAFATVRRMVAAHHERPDGSGYFRGLANDEVPVGARIIGAADCFDELTHDAPARTALPHENALKRMSGDVGGAIFADAYEALQGVLQSGGTLQASGAEHESVPVPKSMPSAWPAGLSDREVEVLRMLCAGASRRDVAQRLSLSEHTVRHHLEHIYAKIDVRTRVEATLFAIEHGLLE